jgi:hypothetical protein
MRQKAGPIMVVLAVVVLASFMFFMYQRTMAPRPRPANYATAWERIREPQNMAKVKELLKTKYGSGGQATAP